MNGFGILRRFAPRAQIDGALIDGATQTRVICIDMLREERWYLDLAEQSGEGSGASA